MNSDVLEGKWHQVKGKVKSSFAKLTDDDLTRAEGDTERMVGILQERYGYTRERAQEEWNNFTRQYGDAKTGEWKDSTETVRDFTKQAQETATQTIDRVKQTATSTLEDVTQRASSMVNERQQQAAEQLQGVAKALQTTGRELEEGQQETFAHYATVAAEQVENLSNFIRTRRPRELLGEIQDFAHRQPELFVMGSLAAGFLLGRFLRSSSTQASAQRSGSANWGSHTATPVQNYGQGVPMTQQAATAGTPNDPYQQWQQYTTAGASAGRNPTTATRPATSPRPESTPQRPQQA